MNKKEFKNLTKKYIAATASLGEKEVIGLFLEKLQHKNQHIVVPVNHQTGERLYAQIQKKIGKKKRINYIGYKIVAVILLLLGLAGFLAHFLQQPCITQIANKGEKKSIELNDGSRIILNSGSEINYPENFTEQREVVLKGEAFFEIARNPEKPFRIKSGEVETMVLGTSFNINTTKKGHVQVSVNSGKVKVAHQNTAGQPVTLKPNMQIDFAKNGTYKIARDKSENYNAWTRNTILLKNHNLLETAEILENWYDVEIEFANPELKKLTISGKFKDENLETVLKSIALIKNLKIEYETPKKISIRKSPKN